MQASRIIPTIFSRNKKEFYGKLNKLLPVSKKLQIDFMDGVFVQEKSVEPRFIPDLSKYKNTFEAHLMVINPEKYFEKIKNKGFKKIVVHIESFNSLQDIITFFKKLKKLKIKPVLAINPRTRLDELIINNFDYFLIMGVQPGKEKQSLKNSVYNKIKKIKKENPNATIQIDGGANTTNVRKLFKAGAHYINSGSFISSSNEPKKALESLLKK